MPRSGPRSPRRSKSTTARATRCPRRPAGSTYPKCGCGRSPNGTFSPLPVLVLYRLHRVVAVLMWVAITTVAFNTAMDCDHSGVAVGTLSRCGRPDPRQHDDTHRQGDPGCPWSPPVVPSSSSFRGIRRSQTAEFSFNPLHRPAEELLVPLDTHEAPPGPHACDPRRA